mgnify:CR=1 FL=1|tara:strand:+ start:296 stop:481 length:186 start_codon:yes stop_codon:yes gene_type:complete
MDYLVSTNRNKLTKKAKKKMSVSREDMIWEAELAAEELEELSEDKLGKLENMAWDNERMED